MQNDAASILASPLDKDIPLPRLLIVDDDKDAADALSEVLERRGYAVRLAYNSSEAHIAVEEYNPEIALIDVRLGKENGIDLIGQITQNYPQIPCIVLTAYADLDVAIGAVRQGAYDFLHKPFDLKLLQSVLGRCHVLIQLQRKIKRTEEQLYQSQKMKTVGQLTGGVAHDFNNLLGVIIGNLDFLAEDLAGNEELFPLVNKATAAALHGAALNRQLLAFSRRQSLSPQKVDVNDTVSNTLELLKRTLGASIAIDLKPNNQLWTAEIDPLHLESALLNLAVNARDAMYDGGTLTIETANIELDKCYAAMQIEVIPGEYIMLALSDTGGGIEAENLERAFEPFFTTKEVGQGSGLGLSMVFGFAKQSGGHVTIDSEVGQGTTVRLYLPRAQPDNPAEVDAPGEIPRAEGETILVVEDDSDLLQLIVKMLEDLGYKVLQAGNGSEALTLMERREQIHILLTDVVLPGGVSGLQIANQAAQILPGIKTLFMSGYSQDAITKQSGLPEGISLIKKPFRKVNLELKLRKALPYDG
jgi:signal transduction histidine kinase